jgi:hypothetical protein
MRQTSSHVPALVLSEASGGRVAYLPADLDRIFARSRIADHARLIANLTRWVAGDRMPLSVQGAGFVHPQLYRQGERFILHLVNLTGHETGSMPVYEFVSIGPFEVSVHTGGGVGQLKARALVGGCTLEARHRDGWTTVTVDRIADHEVLVFE